MREERNEVNDGLPYKPNEAEGECILHKISPVVLNKIKFALYIMISIILAGIPVLLVHWFPSLKRIFYYDFCQLETCTHLCIINYDQEMSICEKEQGQIYISEEKPTNCQYFTNRYLRYLIDQSGTVTAQSFDSKGRTFRIMSQQNIGLNDEQVNQIRRCYGPGTMVINQPSACQLLLRELFRPLYMFLFFSIGLWISEKYYYYAGILFVTSALAILVGLYQMVQLNQKIYQMAYYQIKLNCLRKCVVAEVSSLDLVPGDVVFLKDPIKIPFEGIILEGNALINECALTGQSVPVVKKADVLEKYQNAKEKLDKSAQVFEGTTIIQVNSKKKMARFESTREAYGIPVCVTRTNFSTMKGQLIRIILFPKQQQNVFQRESGKFLFFLFALAIVTYFGILNKLQEVVAPLDIFIKFLDLIAITVPPALPVSMAFGVIYAIDKLKEKSIFCIEESKVIVGGIVNLCCFDKTGTLTEDYMDFQCLIPAQASKLYPTIHNKGKDKEKMQQNSSVDENLKKMIKEKPYLYRILSNMASNHSIIKIQSTGELVGDPMEVKLLEFGGFQLNQTTSDSDIIFSYESKRGHKGDVYRRYQFDSDVQRMSVICKDAEESDFYVYTKGSPEIMVTIMDKNTVPDDYQKALKEYTSNGFRVLTIAHKKLKHDVKTVQRKQAEEDLHFDGFEVFQNKLKPQSKGAIQQLKEAQIGVVMITGDNPLTGSNIGYKCNISSKLKKMIICDYSNKQFTEEEFVYHERDQEVIHERKNHTTEKKDPYLQINLNTSADIFEKEHKKNLQEQFKEQKQFKPQNNKVFNAIASVKEIPSDAVEFMQNMIMKAKSTNSQLCVTGSAFNVLFDGNIEEIDAVRRSFLECSTVFARTKPNDKAKIVMVYQHLGNTVSMCGDGANDCGALKQADIGLSLSQAEASISAPFTSQVANISSMVELIKECRAGLATNFSLFNIMATYSLIQYSTSIICQIFYSYSTDFHYMYWDIVCNFFFIVVLGYTGTAEKLSIQRPNNSLFCFTNLFQVMVVFALQILGQICMILAYGGVFAERTNYINIGSFQVNKVRYAEDNAFVLDTPETNILFLFTNFMYIFTLVGFTIGNPWKKSFYTNIPFMIVLSLSLIYSILIVMVPETRIPLFNLNHIDNRQLCAFVLGMGLLFGIVIFVLQKFVLEPFSAYLKAKYPEKKWL